MALTQVTGPYPIFTDLDGTPLDDGYLYIGAINDDPETNPIQVFWDSNLTIPATQPIRTNNGYAWRNGTPGLLYTGGEFSITIRNKRNEFVLYSPVGYGFDPAAVSASVVKNDFVGDGVEVNFTLSSAPSTKLATNIFINGVYQEKDSYSLAGNVITFTVAPPLSSSIEIMTNETGVINSGNATAISYTLTAPGAVQQTVQTKLEQYVSVKDFGAVGDDLTDNTAAIQAARDYAAARSYAGNTTCITWPAGRYKYTASPNWAIIGLQMDFQGEVWLINEGTGPSMIFDGGAAGSGVYGIQITGFPRIYGDASTQHGIYARSIYRSTFEVNVRGAGTAYSGFYGEWLVSNSISFIMNFNEGGLYSVPARGVTVTARVGDGLRSGWNNFWNPECSGLPIGFYVDGAFGTKIFGGAIQNNTVGAVVTSNAESTTFYGTDFEANPTNDIEDAGNGSQYMNCDFEDGPRFVNGARGGKVIGGAMQNIWVDSGAINTLLSGCNYDWALVPGTGTITDNGTRTRYRDVRNDTSNLVYNVPRDRTVLSVGASPYTYTNNSGNDEEIIVSGGIVSDITLTRFSGYPTGLSGGQFRLTPGDSITVDYTLGSPPTMVVWTT